MRKGNNILETRSRHTTTAGTRQGQEKALRAIKASGKAHHGFKLTTRSRTL
jgi:hypothetical protein